MRPYIIINGKNSNNIEGLVVSTLPPIIKPAIRTNIEEIDGRDGDIVTKLGYSAYDKELDIGLSYKYNVDDVIDYFDSEGIIAFSNEPDKFYRFQALEQIDFEKLVRFKTAKVTFHCQPFKYSCAEHTRIYEINDSKGNVVVRNNGNVYSEPIITIKARGEVNISLNNNSNLTLLFSDTEYQTIKIDVEGLNAYYESGAFANRAIAGDYADLRFDIGRNTLSYSGIVKEITFNNYSRWI